MRSKVIPMILSNEEQNNIKQYLLGNLTEDVRQQVEERLLTEEDFFAELLFSEDELIDQYLAEKLSDEQRDKFEQHFLSTPERQQKLRFGRAFNRYTSEMPEAAFKRGVETRQAPSVAMSPPPGSTWSDRLRAFSRSQPWALRAAMAVALIVIIAGTLWLSRPRTTSPRTFATITLHVSSNTRAEGAQATKVPLPLNADALRISLTRPARSTPAARYSVELMNSRGETKSLEVAGQDAQSISIIIPAAQLTRGRFALKLFMFGGDGTEQRISGDYFFTVE